MNYRSLIMTLAALSLTPFLGACERTQDQMTSAATKQEGNQKRRNILPPVMPKTRIRRSEERTARRVVRIPTRPARVRPIRPAQVDPAI
jgi:hypothetical protein